MVYGLWHAYSAVFLSLMANVSNAIQKNKPLYAFRQVQPISSIIAIAGFDLFVKFFVILCILAVAYYLHLETKIANPLAVLFILIQVWLIATSLGILFALAKCYVPEIAKLQSLAMRPIFFISGIFFSLQDIPREYWHYLTWNPLLHAVELSRYAAYPNYGDAGVSYFFLIPLL
ncbi:ABC transporter permease [Marinomonas sp. GJ51-6]|uniref:ABC transporter permease n=1 Tax=Marinomonas sp. GJ51-6 TaxID=2992802 RepID=UPI00293450AE|nr:ABC transporter permease [Marinomonas sp. GJ51-6]WOD06142.1 ABC transporter permease [Marinomonas sp. GJ51-6]